MRPVVAASATSAVLLGTLVLLAAPGDSSRARRRHLPPPSAANIRQQQSELAREDSSLPGVSIWTSKRVAREVSRKGGRVSGVWRAEEEGRRRAENGRSCGIPFAGEGRGAERGGRYYEQANVRKQDGRESVDDADVEPPSRGEQEGQEALCEDEEGYGAVLTSEEEEDEHDAGDAARGRLLEEGGGSDSQEGDSDEDDTDDDLDDDHDRDGDSFHDASGDSQSDDDDDDGVTRASSPGLGRGGVSRIGDAGRLQHRGRLEGDGSRDALSLAKKYEEDEEACFARVKELWEERVLLPLSPTEVGELSANVRADQKKLMEAAPTEWSANARAARKAAADEQRGSVEEEAGVGGDRSLRVGEDTLFDDSTSQGLLYRLLLAEMQGDGPSGGLNNRWIDRDALLQLRGAATLAHHPEYLRHTANLPRVSRGVRVVAPEATHGMQEALARSLSHSTGSKLVLLDGMALESVRGRALADGIPKERLTSRHLTSALLEVVKEDGLPSVVFLMDKGSAVLKNRGMCQRVTEELKDESSRVLFILSSANDPAVPGNAASGPREDNAGQDGPPQSNGIFGAPLQWPPPPNVMSPGQSKRNMQDGSQPKKKFIFLQQSPQDGSGGGGDPSSFFGGRSPNRGGRGGRSGGRVGGPSAPGQGFGRGMPGPPVPPQMIEQLLKEAMKLMNERASEGERNKQDPNAPPSDHQDEAGHHGGGPGGAGGGGDQFPPGLMEALGEALNDDEFKRTLEQIGKQLGKDMNQSFSIMFSASRAPPGAGAAGAGRADEEDGDGDNTEGEGEGQSDPWGAGGPVGNSGSSGKGGGGGGGSWQGSSSLSWLTNLRKGIMSGDESREGEHANEEEDLDRTSSGHNHNGDKNTHRGRGEGGVGGGGGSGGVGGEGADGRKPDTRRSVELPPSGTEIRAFVSCFEDIVVNPPQDAILRQHWDTWVKEDIGKHNTQQNRQALMTALRRNMLACPELKRLDPLLARHRLTEAETGQVVLSSLKVELTKVAATAAAAVAAISASNTSAVVSGDGLEGGTLFARDVTSASPAGVAHPIPFEPRKTAKGRLIISRGSMETAFAAVCKAYVPRPGQPMSRTREEVNALAQHDRHEQALVMNVILPKDIGVTYDMIGGLGGAKELLRQCITYPLRFPHLYNEGIAKEAVKGVLLFGPPGTGKTMLAKAVATEGGATFLSVDASVIENKWLGESEKNARAVFTLARRLAPCVIFIDEVDSVLSSREKYDDTTHGTLTSVKTTLMQEWDGLRTGGDRVVVIASTNRPFDLDEAVLRRLPRRILVDLPDAETREEILKVSMAQNRVDASVNFTAITQELEGFTGSDIKEVCREAVVRIAHEKAHELDRAGVGPGEEIDLTAQLRPVTMEDFWEARKKLTASVSEKGRELARVWEWNEEYGEVKKKRSDASAHHLSMYL